MESPGDICLYCKSPLENNYRCFQCICKKGGNNCSNGYCTVCNRLINQIQQYSCEFCGGPHYENVCQLGDSFVYEQFSDDNQNYQNDQNPLWKLSCLLGAAYKALIIPRLGLRGQSCLHVSLWTKRLWLCAIRTSSYYVCQLPVY